jgi:uncharacterized protein (UPF0371 family)
VSRRDVDPHDRRLQLVVWLCILTAAAVVFLAVIGVPKVVSTADTTSAVRRSADVTACRAYYKSVADGKADAVDDASTAINVLVLDGLAATAQGDDNGLREVVAQVRDAENRLTAARAQASEASKQYQAKVLLSRSDPTAFLAECSRDGG